MASHRRERFTMHWWRLNGSLIMHTVALSGDPINAIDAAERLIRPYYRFFSWRTTPSNDIVSTFMNAAIESEQLHMRNGRLGHRYSNKGVLQAYISELEDVLVYILTRSGSSKETLADDATVAKCREVIKILRSHAPCGFSGTGDRYRKFEVIYA